MWKNNMRRLAISLFEAHGNWRRHLRPSCQQPTRRLWKCCCCVVFFSKSFFYIVMMMILFFCFILRSGCLSLSALDVLWIPNDKLNSIHHIHRPIEKSNVQPSSSFNSLPLLSALFEKTPDILARHATIKKLQKNTHTSPPFHSDVTWISIVVVMVSYRCTEKEIELGELYMDKYIGLISLFTLSLSLSLSLSSLSFTFFSFFYWWYLGSRIDFLADGVTKTPFHVINSVLEIFSSRGAISSSSSNKQQRKEGRGLKGYLGT